MSFAIYGFEQLFSVMRYPAGESHVTANFVPTKDNVVVVASHVRNFEDLCNCVTANKILQHNGVEAEWFIPYFPFARHDRRRDKLDGLELKFALEMVKDLNVTVLDPHSDVLGQVKHFTQATVVNEFLALGLENVPNPMFIIPDHGATKKAYSWLDGKMYLQATKVRDPSSGVLSGFYVYNEALAFEKDCIIVDDICDAGGTFLGIAEHLKRAGANSLTLAVTHGLFTKGLESIQKTFSRVFTIGHWQRDVERIGYGLFFERNAYDRC